MHYSVNYIILNINFEIYIWLYIPNFAFKEWSSSD